MKSSNIILIKNLDFWRQKYELKIGEFEDLLGVSKGYLSRLERSENAFPPAEILLKMTKELQTTIDFLLNVDMSSIGSNTLLIHNFLTRLKNDTVIGKINWELELSDDFFLKNNEYKRENVDSPYRASYTNQLFFTEYENGKVVYLQPLYFEPEGKHRKNSSKIGYELFIRNSKEEDKITICFSDTVVDTIARELHELHLIIDQKINDTSLGNEATEAIIDILNL